MDIREEIIENIRNLNTYLEGISLDELKKTYSRLELKEFYKQLYAERTRSLAYEISQMTDEMKKEEFPDLLGVHYFPIIKEMIFLTQEEKIALDKYLARLRKNYRASNWHLVTNDKDKYIQIQEFLLEKEIVSERFIVSCPHCNDSHLSAYLSKEQKEEFEQNLIKYHQDNDMEALSKAEQVVEYEFCDECEQLVAIDDTKKYSFEQCILMVASPDLTLENIE